MARKKVAPDEVRAFALGLPATTERPLLRQTADDHF
jgi:hypothetical protein